jgi:hypothetical protein
MGLQTARALGSRQVNEVPELTAAVPEMRVSSDWKQRRAGHRLVLKVLLNRFQFIIY